MAFHCGILHSRLRNRFRKAFRKQASRLRSRPVSRPRFKMSHGGAPMKLTWGAVGLMIALAMGMPGEARAQGPWTVASPDGDLTFELTLGSDSLSYTVGHRHDGA